MVHDTGFLENILEQKQINITAMRLLVLDALLQHQHAVSVNDLEKMLQPVDRITIYRSIKTFEQRGLVHFIADGSGSDKFALCAETCGPGGHQDMHVHFLCNVCHNTLCLPKALIPPVVLPQGFYTEAYELLVKGICQSCAEKESM